MTIKAKLGTFDTTMIVISLVVGIGIFRTPAMVASATGTPTLFFAAWIIGGLVSLAGALTFAEIGSRCPYPGASYKVVADCYSSLLAFMLNWINLVLVNGAGCAAIALIAAEYLNPVLLPQSLQTPAAVRTVAVGLVLFLLLINYLGIRTGAWAQNLLSLLKIGMILFLGLAALRSTESPEPVSSLAAVPGGSFLLALGVALIAVFYTFDGYQVSINFGGDVRQAKRSLPRGIVIGMVIVFALYLLLNFAYIRVLGIQGIAGADLAAAELARAVFGDLGRTLISIAIFFSAVGILNVSLMHLPRSYYAMADDGVLPRIFASVNPRTQTQQFALGFLGATVLISVFFLGTFEKIVQTIIFFNSLNLAVKASTVFLLRHRARREPGGIDAFRAPLYPFLPGLFVLILLWMALNILLNDPRGTLIGLLIFALGLPAYPLMCRVSRSVSSRDRAETH